MKFFSKRSIIFSFARVYEKIKHDRSICVPGYEFKSADEYLYGDSVVFFTCARKKIVRWPNRRVHVCPPLKRKIDRASLRLLFVIHEEGKSVSRYSENLKDISKSLLEQISEFSIQFWRIFRS